MVEQAKLGIIPVSARVFGFLKAHHTNTEPKVGVYKLMFRSTRNDIMAIYQAQNQWAEAKAFFSSRLPKASAEPTAQGLLHLYLAILNTQLERPQVARPHFLAAHTQLRKVVKLENTTFQVINKGLAESNP